MRKLAFALLLVTVTYLFARRELPGDTAPLTSPDIELRAPSTARGIAARPEAASPRASFECDGRTHCSQMRSCAEAKYFLAHCPNTEMDGDADGVPCEHQWCG
ncbi:excalibur calcium-binding domain-containing protein [Tahibacter soli]|uniref:excalibur calcium-binding domain-containing protein n=1 Tax=Tahibacter soli TaxID=2983605 RepID=UPI003010315C